MKMGYCYANGHLVCDICSNYGGVRKVRCPFGWCQPTAACPECRKKHKAEFGKPKHREHGCEKYALQHDANEQERVDIIAAGGFVLVAGTSVDKNTVHAIFKGKDGEIARFVPDVVYDHWNERPNATVAFFEELAGFALPVAPVSFHTKQVHIGGGQ